MPQQRPWTMTKLGVKLVTLGLVIVLASVNQAAVIRRQATSGIIRENIQNDVNLFNVEGDIVEKGRPGVTWRYQITGTSIPGSDIFYITAGSDSGELRLERGLSEDNRKLFDFETHPEIFVNVSATNVNDNSDVIMYTIKLRLSDVNDESPMFANEPVPFLAVVGENPQSGTIVYTLTTKDLDTRSKIVLEQSGSESRFVWREISRTDGSPDLRGGSTVVYNLVTIGTNSFTLNEEITVPITVKDSSVASNLQRSTATVRVKVGRRPPQIYKTKYEGYIYETTGENKVQSTDVPNDTPLEILAKPFHNGPLTIRLLENGIVSNNYAMQDNKYIVNKQDVVFVDSAAKRLTIEVTENAGTQSALTSTAQLEIQVIDENDNSPVFTQPNYPVSIPEDVAIDYLVVRVTASDADSGQNGELVFSVDDDSFTVDTVGNRGDVRVAKPLDYERAGGWTYSVQITARDKGPVPKSGIARITITLQNVNDNPPLIDPRTEDISLLESAVQGSVVFVVQASDVDGDTFDFSIQSQSPRTSGVIFGIDTQGVVRLQGNIGADVGEYNLVIMVTDKGDCCQPVRRQSSSATFTVSIVDVNEDRPDFTTCNSYETTEVPELSPPGTSVVQVSAADDDRGVNGEVIYSLHHSTDLNDPSRKFEIDSASGEITIKERFSREDIGRDYIQVTVKGRNPGDRPIMEGWCTFRVTVKDVNNHPPIFNPNVMTVPLSQNTPRGGVVVTVRATDEDTGANGNIVYTLQIDDQQFKDVFTINEITGMITLENALSPGVMTYFVRVVATDQGSPQTLNGTLDLTIEVKGQGTPPVWRPSSTEYEIEEETDPGTVIDTLYCSPNQAGDPLVQFLVYDETLDTASDLFKAQGDDTPDSSGYYKMNLVTLKSNYDVNKDYRITITCRTTGQNSAQVDLNPLIRVRDVNNRIPKFQGLSLRCCYEAYIKEDARAGDVVIDVSATDDDILPGNRDVTFSFGSQNSQETPDPSTLFEITNLDGNRARVTVKQALADILDRETREFYEIWILAEDGAPANPPLDQNDPTAPNSAVRTIRVRVTDVNDKSPFFNLTEYECNAMETLNTGAIVCTVKAVDEDELDVQGLTYYFDRGNVDNAFSVRNFAGDITVNGKLDYESNSAPKTYLLGLIAVDGVGHTASTNVRINVIDMNDNKPVFTQKEYDVTGIVEENNSTTSAQNPVFLVQVSATDADISRTQTDIRYSLLGTYTEPSDRKFIIDEEGKIFLIGMLDREETNNPTFSFNVLAEDEPVNPNVGYATVKVTPIDVNDNSPEFNEESLQGFVDEHSTIGTSCCTILASDKDAGDNAKVSFSKADNQFQASQLDASYFLVSSSGEVTTNTDQANLDRENQASYLVVVLAYDGGSESRTTTGTLTITLRDINDQSPEFDKNLYLISISENTEIGPIETIRATDADSDPVNKNLVYTIAPEDYFAVTNRDNSGDITLIKALDYESGTTEFDLTLTVQDGDPTHTATTKVHITVLDFNDHKPQFVEDKINVTLQEEVPAGQYVTTFYARDDDGTSPNNKFTFSIDQESDRYYEFFIHPTKGNVTTRKPLDREKDGIRTIYILAIDEGEAPQTSTATLEVTLEDINDNAPRFKEDYQPVVQENVQNNDRLVVTLMAVDPDTPKYGPPFRFSLPQGCNTPACQKFTLTFDPSGDNNRGSAAVRTSTTFDREQQKQYFLPVIISDMDGSSSTEQQSATNTLTITIGDENDNPQKPGHQDIFTYVMGDVTKERMQIGQVFVEDPDDWDLKDKTFTNVTPLQMGDFFFVDKDTGMITVQPGVPVPADQKPYTFQVTVYDSVHKVTVTSTVSVRLVTLSDQAVHKAGTMRLAGITGAEFISKARNQPNAKSKFDHFEEQMSSILGYPATGKHVQIVSLNEVGPDLDVRFAAHGSPYLNPAQVESAVMLNKEQVSKGVGVDIMQVPVNLCQNEVYADGCSTVATVTGRSHLTNANGTSFVGAETVLSAEAGCSDYMFPQSDECTGDYCFNGGTCVKDDWGRLSCQCTAGFDGPRCQQTHHHFGGDDVAFYKDLEACSDGRTSIDFITEQENGIIMYSGPTTAIDIQKDPQDFFVLELIAGYPSLRINLGSEETELRLNGQDQAGNVRMPKLNDGKWHHIDIDKSDQHITMMVDYCRAAEEFNGTVSDWSPCRAESTVPGGDILLVTGGFLQLGHRYPLASPPAYPAGLGTQGFNGCLKNLMHNTKMYDLYYKKIASISSGENGCPREQSLCGTNGNNPVCGVNAACESQWGTTPQVVKCTCLPGWYGDKCNQTTPIKDFQRDKSYFKWRLGDQVITNALRDQSIDIIFRTRQTSGNLFTMTDNQQHRFLLQLVDGHPSVSYDLGSGIQTLTLESLGNTGHWHVVHLERHGNDLSLRLDGGEGRNYKYSASQRDVNVIYRPLPYVSSGASVPSVEEKPPDDFILDDLISSCVQDIRFDELFLPMEESQTLNGNTLIAEQYVAAGCQRDDCKPDPCNEGTCYPLWEEYQCRCPGDLLEATNGLCPNLCVPNPCFNAVPCSVVGEGVTCKCNPGWSGDLCNVMAVSDDDGNDALGAGTIAGIVIGIIVLLALIAVIILFLLCRKEDDEERIVKVDPDDDFIRENVMFYDDEGAGEMDNQGYDMSILTRPSVREAPFTASVQPYAEQKPVRRSGPQESPHEVDNRPDVGHFIDDRIKQAEDPNEDPFTDSVHQFNHEGGGSDAGSLSSLNTGSSDGSQDYDFLGDWGHKFARLADMYGAGQNLDKE